MLDYVRRSVEAWLCLPSYRRRIGGNWYYVFDSMSMSNYWTQRPNECSDILGIEDYSGIGFTIRNFLRSAESTAPENPCAISLSPDSQPRSHMLASSQPTTFR